MIIIDGNSHSGKEWSVSDATLERMAKIANISSEALFQSISKLVAEKAPAYGSEISVKGKRLEIVLSNYGYFGRILIRSI